ncbi:hypothetical protein ABWU89_21460 [Paenibacillus amylolyticus]|uniref:hypothetical protein n=1 Tax=unclassified Paenibacillus TaxID=185978 RepID=UPI0011800967|nr:MULTISPECIES: hypothetical protein [unclassified Paenibacillus]
MPFRTHCLCHLRKPGLNTPVFRERIFYLRNWTTPGFLKEEHNRRLNLRVELNKRLSFLFGVVLNTSRAKAKPILFQSFLVSFHASGLAPRSALPKLQTEFQPRLA